MPPKNNSQQNEQRVLSPGAPLEHLLLNSRAKLLQDLETVAHGVALGLA